MAIAVAVVVSACGAGLLYLSPKPDVPRAPGIAVEPPEVRQRLDRMLDKATDGQQVGTLRDLTDFDWDTAYVLTEHTAIDTIHDLTGDSLAEDGWSVPALSALFVFREGGATIRSIQLGDVYFETRPEQVWLPDTQIIARHDADDHSDAFRSFRLAKPSAP